MSELDYHLTAVRTQLAVLTMIELMTTIIGDDDNVINTEMVRCMY